MAKSVEHNIFPDQAPRSEIFHKIDLIEKGWLDQTTELSFPDQIRNLVNSLQFFKIEGVQAGYDEKEGRLQAHSLNLNLLSAIYNQRFPLLYIVLCQKGKIELFFGTNAAGAGALASLMEAISGSSLYEKISRSTSLESITGYSACAALTGIPTLFDAKNRRMSPRPLQVDTGMDNLITGLTQEEWAYVIQAFPIPRPQTSTLLESCASEIKDIKELFLNRELQKSNRMAAYYVDILEKSLKRLTAGKQQGLWQTGVYLLAENNETVSRGAALLTAIFSGDKSTPEPVRTHLCVHGAKDSAFINYYNTTELQSFISLPAREHPGFSLQEQIHFDVNFTYQGQKTLDIGRVFSGNTLTAQQCTVPIDELTKHGLVAGVTGSGKTSTVFNLLTALKNSGNIPFLVIEPAKSEYRDLLPEIKDLQVFTLGEERPGLSAPFRLNPFAFPVGVSLQTHIDFLKAVFHASFVMYAPMPYVLEECLYKIYEDKGWNLVTSENYRGLTEKAFPTLNDLYHKIDPVVNSLGYQDRTTMDIKAALKTRIKNLCLGGKGLMLNTGVSVSFSEIMKFPTVMELKYLGNDEEKAFMMGLILMSLWEYYESGLGQKPVSTGGLTHLTVIEEAHRLLKNVSTEKSSEEVNNIKGMGVETFSNLLAEIRACGEGVLVAEQIPTKLAPDVIKNSNLKIMHRLVAKEDRETMGAAMNLDKLQQREVVSLKTGQAIFFSEGLDRPVKIGMPLAPVKAAGAKVSDATLSRHMASQFYSRNSSLLRKFTACQNCPERDKDCARIKREVEQLCMAPGWVENQARFFLPFFHEVDSGDSGKQLRRVFYLPESHYYCLAAHLIDDYINSKGDYHSWSFAEMTSLSDKAQNAISNGSYPRTVSAFCRSQTSPGRYAVCKNICTHKCLFGYEGGIMAHDAHLHNRLLALVESSDYGPRFYLELVMLLGDYLKDFFPDNHLQYIRTVGLCYLVQKLNAFSFSQPLQERILKEFLVTANRVG